MVAGYNPKSKKYIVYPNTPSDIRPIRHAPEILVSLHSELDVLPSDSNNTETEYAVHDTYDYESDN
ncbi:hypothetical protein C0J52_22097 [Blattella germanica]|nr:hypothetical protein C0J52_22097 [Blattella germanica]